MNLFASRLFFVLSCMTAMTFAADWPQWRGPDRNGFSAEPVKLIDSLPAGPLQPVWKSEKILSDKDGGFSSPVVAGGRVFEYCTWRTYHNLDVLQISREDARGSGLIIPDKVDDALVARLDSARPSLLASRDWGDRQKAARAWIDSNLNADEKKLLGGFAENRLMKGNDMLPVPVLRKVMSLIGRQFAKQADLDAWYAENGIEEPARAPINSCFPKQSSTIEDIVFCLDAATGKTLWKKSWPGAAGTWGLSTVPLIAGKRLYFLGGNGVVRCLDTESGNELWKTAKPLTPNGDPGNSSLALLDGNLFVLCGHLYALKADTGAILWDQGKASGNHSSPTLWTTQGKTFLVCGGSTIACVLPQDGKVLWTVKGGQMSTPVITGSSMAVAESSAGITFYHITPETAEKAAETKSGSTRGASPATDGKFFFTTGSKEAVAFDAGTFAEVWKVPGLKEEFASPIIADGKLIGFSDKGEVGMFNPATGESLGKAGCGALRCTSPVIAGGFLFVRTKEAVVCFDLRKKP